MILNQRKKGFPTVYNMIPFDEKNICFLPIWRHHRVTQEKKILERRSYDKPLESSFYADSESSKSHGLKMKSWRDILNWIWACDVTWPNWNRNISPGLHFQTMVLMWFLISVALAFQRHITWPPLEKKNIFAYYDVTWYAVMTSQKNGPIEYFHFSKIGKYLVHRPRKYKNLRWVFF